MRLRLWLLEQHRTPCLYRIAYHNPPRISSSIPRHDLAFRQADLSNLVAQAPRLLVSASSKEKVAEAADMGVGYPASRV